MRVAAGRRLLQLQARSGDGDGVERGSDVGALVSSLIINTLSQFSLTLIFLFYFRGLFKLALYRPNSNLASRQRPRRCTVIQQPPPRPCQAVVLLLTP